MHEEYEEDDDFTLRPWGDSRFKRFYCGLFRRLAILRDRSLTMQRTFGGKLWSLVQFACVMYAGQKAFGALQRSLQTKREEIQAKRANSEKVDIASEDSFPASDPPAWGGSHAVGPVH